MTTIYQLIVSIIVGLVQAISEWLPISSKTQVLAASQLLLKLNFSQAYTFGLFMEVGTLIAAIIYFRRELWALITVLLGSKDAVRRKLFVYVLTTTIITGILGAPLYLYADSLTGIPIGIPMILIGIVLIADAFIIHYARKRHEAGANRRKFEDMGIRDYIVVGITQGISALPGVSRSGITTSALLLLDIEADEAFRLSFIIGIFATAAAVLLTVVVSKANVTAALAGISTLGLVVAIITATIASLFLIDFLIKVAGKSNISYLASALGAIAIASGLLYFFLGL